MKKRFNFFFLIPKAITDDKCYEEGKSNAYNGKINVTETGYTCLRWDSEAKKEYQMFHLENYCRSPNGAPFPWCLSTAPGKIWEKCQIPICGKSISYQKRKLKYFLYHIVLDRYTKFEFGGGVEGPAEKINKSFLFEQISYLLR